MSLRNQRDEDCRMKRKKSNSKTRKKKWMDLNPNPTTQGISRINLESQSSLSINYTQKLELTKFLNSQELLVQVLIIKTNHGTTIEQN
jgi:hypothetical protein